MPSSNGHAISYEHHLVHTAQELLREIARHFEALDATGAEPNAGYNSRCAWRALDDMGKIEL